MCLLASWGCMDSDSHESGALMQVSLKKKKSGVALMRKTALMRRHQTFTGPQQ